MNNSALSRIRLSLKVLLLPAVLYFSAQLSAAARDTFIIYYSSEYENLSQSLSQQLPQLSAINNIRQININNFTIAQLEAIQASSSRCAITLGETSLKTVLSTRQKTRLFSLMVARHQLDTLREIYSRFGIELAGIYQEQSFDRQLNLIKAIQPDAQHVALALGPKTRYWLNEYRQITQRHALSLMVNLLTLQSNLHRFVEQISTQETFLTIINDPDIYSPTQLQSVLVTSYKKNIPLIGSKLSDAENAAMVSVYTPDQLLVTEVTQELDQFCGQSKLPDNRYARNFSVIVNSSIAESLSYSKLDSHALKIKLLALEKEAK